MAKPAVILVAADKGGVGKTTIARTLLDYFNAHRVPIRAFDTECPKGTLKRFHPEMTSIIDITEVSDQMQVFDTLTSAQAPVTLIDVRAGLMSATLRALRDFGFLDAARKGQIAFALFHVLGPTVASLDEIGDIAAVLGEARYFMVKNFINNAHFFQRDAEARGLYLKRSKSVAEITIPKLNEMATVEVDLASVSFVNFISNKDNDGEAAAHSFVLRGYVRNWLGNVWAEYDRIALADIAELRSAPDLRAQAHG